jgi:hypothetical protein
MVQFVDISVFNNGFAGASFINSEPLAPNQTAYTWPGIRKQIRHYWRVNALMPDGSWATSETGVFVPCGYTNSPTTQCNEPPPELHAPGTQMPEPGHGVTFLFDEGVAIYDRYFYTRGILEAQAFLTRHLGRIVEQPFCVDVRAVDVGHDFTAAAFGHRIISYSSNPVWRAIDEPTKIRVVIHEYFHVLQADLAGNYTDWGPTWLVEGMAETVSFRAINEAGLMTLDQARSLRGLTGRYETVRRIPSLATDWDILCNEGNCYSLAWMAIDRLLQDRPLMALRTYSEAIGGGVRWEVAFANVFGTTLEQFYEDFEAYRRTLYGDGRR